MATPKSTAGHALDKNMNGLKGHMKAMKEKKLAKRTAAAEKAKLKKTSSAPVAVVVAKDSTPAQEEAVGDVETAPIAKTTADVVARAEGSKGKSRSDSAIAVEIVVQTDVIKMMPEQPFDIVAHRKALETALYDNMETPRQMLIRCKYVVPTDAEYHSFDEEEIACETDRFYDYGFHEFKSAVKCLDDNRFEIEPIMTGLTEEDVTTRTKITPPLTVSRLFDMLKDAGLVKISISNPWVSRTLESVEAEMAEMRLAANAFVDPTIISYKIKQPIPNKVDKHVVVTNPYKSDNSEGDNGLTLPLGLPPALMWSPTSSNSSRTSSPVDPQRAHTPLTVYSVAAPSELAVWNTTHMNLEDPLAHGAHQQVQTVQCGNWDAFGNWVPVPGWFETAYTW